MIHYPSFRQLQYLAALYQHQHFGRAAESCFVSQSTLSTGIAQLEEALGASLIERHHRKFVFTSLGLEVVQRAQKLLSQGKELWEYVQEASRPMSGELYLGCIPTIAPFVVGDLLKQCSEQFPQLQLYIRELTSDEALRELQDGRLDTVLLALPYSIGDVHSQIIAEDHFHVVMPENWVKKGITTSMKTWPKGSVLLLEEEHCLSGHAISACRVQNKELLHHFKATSLYTLLQMIEQGMGLSFLPEMAIKKNILADMSVYHAPMQDTHAHRVIALLWRKNSPRLKSFELLAAIIKNLF